MTLVACSLSDENVAHMRSSLVLRRPLSSHRKNSTGHRRIARVGAARPPSSYSRMRCPCLKLFFASPLNHLECTQKTFLAYAVHLHAYLTDIAQIHHLPHRKV